MSHKNCLNRLKNTVFFFVLLPLILIFSFTYLLSDTIYAQTADRISLQGKIVRNDAGYEGLNVVNGTPSCVNSGPDTCNFQVKYYSASSAGDLYFTETFSGVEIGDYGGVFNLSLGSGSTTTSSFCDGTCNTVSEVINYYSTLYIEISFDPTGVGSTPYGEVFTRTPLNASAYAIRAKYADGSINDAFKFYNASSVSSTNTGSVYYDTDDNELKLYNGSSWVSIGNAGATAWASEDISGFTYGIPPAASNFMTSSGIGTLNNFSLDVDDDRLSLNIDQAEGGLSVYSSYNSTGAWPLVSFKADGSSFDRTILELTQDGTGDLLTAYYGSTLEFQIDNYGDAHLANNGVQYFEEWGTAPTSGDLHPNSSEGCIYSYGGDLYWDAACDGTAEESLNGGTGLWSQASGFAYLTTTTDDLVLGASTTSSPPFFFDVSEGRLGIGTGTPQAAIDIAGASSTISNTSGDITITPADDLVLSGGNLGIGIADPSYDLHIDGGAQSIIGLNTSDGSAGYSRIYFKDTTSGNLKWGIQYGSDSYGVTDRQNDLYFYQYYDSSESFINKPIFTIDNTGNIGIGEDEPYAQLTVLGDSDEVQLSVKGNATQTNNLFEVIKSDDSDLMTLSNAGLLTLSGNFEGGTNNTYDIGNTSTRWKDVYTQGSISIGANGDSGGIRYNTTDNQLEFTNDGTTWIPMAGATKTVTLSAEYPGAVLAADGSANVGFMTSDAEGTANDSMNYYEWSSSETSLQDYDIRLRFTIPNDFASWGTDAFTFNLSTESGSSSDNKVDFYLYEESSAIVDDSSTGRYMPAGTWGYTTLQGADLGDCNAAGETCLVLIRMYSANDNYVRVGDIDVNYTRKL